MGFGKFLGVVVGGAIAVVAAPVVLPAAAAVGAVAASAAATAGAAAATAGAVAAGAAATVGTAAASTAVGSAVVGAATTAGAAAVGAAATVGTAAASTAVGSAVVGAATTAGAAAVTAGATAVGAAATVGTTVAAGASTVGSAIAASSLVGAATAAEVGVASAIGATVSYSGINVAEGVSNNEDAKKTAGLAKGKYKRKERELNEAKKITAEKLEKLNLFKIEIYAKDIERSINIIKKIKKPKERDMDFIDGELTFIFDEAELEQMIATVNKSKAVLKEVSNGVSLSYSAASGSLAFMSQFGIASTGTAISSLNGAAAYNATIAAFGGGALSAGGGGMALGHAVLGGITLAPAAVVTSWNFAKQSEKALTEAVAYSATISKEVEKMESIISLLENGINVRIDELYDTIDQLVKLYRNKVYPKLKKAYNDHKDADGIVAFKDCSKEAKDSILLAAFYLKKIKDILSVKILDDLGNPSEASEETIKNVIKSFDKAQ